MVTGSTALTADARAEQLVNQRCRDGDGEPDDEPEPDPLVQLGRRGPVELGFDRAKLHKLHKSLQHSLLVLCPARARHPCHAAEMTIARGDHGAEGRSGRGRSWRGGGRRRGQPRAWCRGRGP